MTWSFFGIEHEKGEWDGIGVVMKKPLKNE
jgi:hypothetical protein